jgi:hypothetical protein
LCAVRFSVFIFTAFEDDFLCRSKRLLVFGSVTEEAVGDFLPARVAGAGSVFLSCRQIFLVPGFSYIGLQAGFVLHAHCVHRVLAATSQCHVFCLFLNLLASSCVLVIFPFSAQERAVSAVCLVSRGVQAERCFSLERDGLRFRSSRAVGLGSVRIPVQSARHWFIFFRSVFTRWLVPRSVLSSTRKSAGIAVPA